MRPVSLCGRGCRCLRLRIFLKHRRALECGVERVGEVPESRFRDPEGPANASGGAGGVLVGLPRSSVQGAYQERYQCRVVAIFTFERRAPWLVDAVPPLVLPRNGAFPVVSPDGFLLSRVVSPQGNRGLWEARLRMEISSRTCCTRRTAPRVRRTGQPAGSIGTSASYSSPRCGQRVSEDSDGSADSDSDPRGSCFRNEGI